MVDTEYVPKRGDLVWLDFNPQRGHEQRGRRPAIVLSPESYNKQTDLALFCPITSKSKGYPFEEKIPSNTIVNGVALTDQVKNLDWKSRNISFIFSLKEESLEKILEKVRTLLG